MTTARRNGGAEDGRGSVILVVYETIERSPGWRNEDLTSHKLAIKAARAVPNTSMSTREWQPVDDVLYVAHKGEALYRDGLEITTQHDSRCARQGDEQPYCVRCEYNRDGVSTLDASHAAAMARTFAAIERKETAYAARDGQARRIGQRTLRFGRAIGATEIWIKGTNTHEEVTGMRYHVHLSLASGADAIDALLSRWVHACREDSSGVTAAA